MNRRKSGSRLKKGNCFCSVLYLEICKFKDFFFFLPKAEKGKKLTASEKAEQKL